MKDENNVIETKTEKENKMPDTTKEIESNVILSKLSEEQFNWLREHFHWDLRFDGFYPTLNTDLLTKIRESGKMFDFLTDDGLIFFIHDYGSVSHSMEDQLISIVKDYGSVSHSLSVSGSMLSTVNFEEKYDISAEKIAELSVDEIESWGYFGEVAENCTQNGSVIDAMDEVNSLARAFHHFEYPDLDEVTVITNVKVVIPEPDVFAEKVVA
jgi:hypothetical protein